MRRSAGVRSHRRTAWVCAFTAALLAVVPHAAQAKPQHASASAAAAGTVYGGKSSQDFPVMIETSRNGRKITDAVIAIRLDCTSGGVIVLPDTYAGLAVSKKRKFGASFGPITNRNDDGTTTDFEGTISGSFNKSRSKASGKWTFKATEHDAAGAVTDTCESGSVSWTAKQ